MVIYVYLRQCTLTFADCFSDPSKLMKMCGGAQEQPELTEEEKAEIQRLKE